MMRHERSYRYIDKLQALVENYNQSLHRSLKGLSPNQVTKQNEADVWSSQYLNPQKKLIKLSYITNPRLGI